MLGANRVAKAPPDGYQFVLGNIGTHAQNQAVYRRPLYNAATDFAPVGLVVNQTLLLLTRKDFPADNLQNFIAYARANQAKLQYGSAGTGGSNHLACLLLNSAIGIEVAHVPYRSGAQALQDTLAGRIDYQCPSLPIALPQINVRGREGARDTEQVPLCKPAGAGVRAGAGSRRLRCGGLVCSVPARSHASAYRAEAQSRPGRDP